MRKLKKKWNGILYEGGYGDFSVNTGLTSYRDSFTETDRRAGQACLLATRPETFELMVKNNVNLFHGTNINALPNILKYGMHSVEQLQRMGITVSTGEEWSRINSTRDFISFTDNLRTAINYAQTHPSKDNLQQESFGVLIGISSKDIEQMRTISVHSSMPEIGIRDSVPLEYIKVIAVPESKVEFVRKLVNNDRIIVTPIDIEERFYNLESIAKTSGMEKELIKGKRQPKSEITFDSESVNKLAEKRKISGIRGIYEKIKKRIMSRGKNNEKDSRDK